MKTSRILSVFILLSLISSLVLGCTQSAPVSKPAATGPQVGGTLRVAIPTAPPTLDPFVATIFSYGTGAVNKIYGQTLVRWGGLNGRDEKIVPSLAKSWEISPDGLSFIFHLQEGVRWQNVPPVNGREFTAEDVKYHYDRVNDPANKHPSRGTYSLKRIDVIDKYTVKLTTTEKVPGMLAFIASGGSVILSKEATEAKGGLAANWVGTGPYILKEYTPESRAVFVKNPDYWEKGKTYLDKIELYFMPDAAARVAAFRAGQIDVLPQEGAINRDNIVKTVPGVQISDGVAMLGAGLWPNLRKTSSPFLDIKVRQSLQYAIDYDGLISSVLNGAGTRFGFLAPWWKDWGGTQIADLPKRDVAKARALLAEAGYPNGFKTTIMQNSGQMEVFGNAVEPVVAMLKEIGIDATIVPVDGASFLSKWRSGDWDMTITNLLGERPFDPDTSIQQQYYSKGNYNQNGYKNAKVDQLTTAERDAFPDQEKRKIIIRELMQQINQDVPGVPLYIATSFYIRQPYVRNLDEVCDPQNAYAGHVLPYAWLDKK